MININQPEKLPYPLECPLNQTQLEGNAIDLPRLRVTREVPLWGILSLLGVVAGWGVSSYYGQVEQAKELTRQGVRQIEMVSDLRAIGTRIQESTLKTVELSFQVSNLEQRIRTLENQTPLKR